MFAKDLSASVRLAFRLVSALVCLNMNLLLRGLWIHSLYVSVREFVPKMYLDVSIKNIQQLK